MTTLTAQPFFRTYDLPWTPGVAAEQRFRRILRNVFVVYAVLAVMIPFLPLVERERTPQPDLPERVVRLVVEQPKPPPPPPPPVEKVQPEVKVAKKVETPVKPVVAPPVDRREQARRKARNTGLLALQDELADLRDDDVAGRLAGSRRLTGAVGDSAVVERSLITAKGGRGSGGIDTASMSRNTGGAGIGDRATTRVASQLAGMAAAAQATVGADGRASRSREEIEMVFDQNKGAIYALYSRALRRDPTLQGKLVLRLTIEPDGTVSACEVVSSEIGDDELLQKLVARVRMFRFVDKDVATVTTTKPIDFFPA
ncbi:MAG: AgmX/PglI C-terminal domain-containing protein [Gammaproteobacteria bacterium]|nr:AgmX/PglI C-terminal domain-containing protein [Gammaproteobacteria bacterium]